MMYHEHEMANLPTSQKRMSTQWNQLQLKRGCKIYIHFEWISYDMIYLFRNNQSSERDGMWVLSATNFFCCWWCKEMFRWDPFFGEGRAGWCKFSVRQSGLGRHYTSYCLKFGIILKFVIVV